MARHVLSPREVVTAFVEKTVDHARTSTETISFDSHDVLYSYALPIAWRTERGKFVVRSQDSTVTTNRHIGLVNTAAFFDALTHVPVEELSRYGIELEDLIDYEYVHELGTTKTTFETPGGVYTLLELHASAFDFSPFHVRNLTPVKFCFEGENIPELKDLIRSLLPPKYLTAAYDGWVAFTGQWFFVGDPEVDARTSGELIKKGVNFGKDHTATEVLGRYVRGVIRGPKESKTLFSFNVNGRELDWCWYLPVEPRLAPLPDPLPEKFYEQALSNEDVECLINPSTN